MRGRFSRHRRKYTPEQGISFRQEASALKAQEMGRGDGCGYREVCRVGGLRKNRLEDQVLKTRGKSREEMKV